MDDSPPSVADRLLVAAAAVVTLAVLCVWLSVLPAVSPGRRTGI